MTDNIKAEPVAWMYELAGARSTNLDGSKTYTNWRRSITNVAPNVPVDGLRNLTPLYTHAQLVEERRLAWNDAIEAAANACEAETDYTTVTPYVHRARLAFVIHNLTKDSTHD